MASAPAGGLDRIAEAYRRAVVKLPDSFQAVNAQLLRPANELALVVVISVWAGLGGGLGYLEDVIASSRSSVDLGPGANVLQRGVVLAATAQNERELDIAAGTVANAMVQVGPARIAALLGNAQFGQLRDVVAGMRQQLLTGRIWPAASPHPPASGTVPVVAPGRRAWVWGAVAATAVTGVFLIAAAHAPKRGSR